MCVRGKSSSYNTSTNVQVLGNAPDFSVLVWQTMKLVRP